MAGAEGSVVVREDGRHNGLEGRRGGEVGKPEASQAVFGTCAAFSPDKRYLLVGFGGGSTSKDPPRTWFADCLILWEIPSGKQVRILPGHQGGVIFTDFLSGDRAISVGRDGELRIWNIKTGDLIGKIATGVVRGAVSADGKRFLAYPVPPRRALELWDLDKARSLNAAKTFSSVHSVALSPKGDLALVAGKDLFLWDVDRWRHRKDFPTEIVGPPSRKLGTIMLRVKGYGAPAAFSPDGRHALLEKRADDKRYLAIWEVVAFRELRHVGDDDLWPAEVHLSDGGAVTCLSREGRLVRWDTDGKERWRFQSKDLLDPRLVAFSRDGNIALIHVGSFKCGPDREPTILGARGMTMDIWDLETGKILTSLPRPHFGK